MRCVALPCSHAALTRAATADGKRHVPGAPATLSAYTPLRDVCVAKRPGAKGEVTCCVLLWPLEGLRCGLRAAVCRCLACECIRRLCESRHCASFQTLLHGHRAYCKRDITRIILELVDSVRTCTVRAAWSRLTSCARLRRASLLRATMSSRDASCLLRPPRETFALEDAPGKNMQRQTATALAVKMSRSASARRADSERTRSNGRTA